MKQSGLFGKPAKEVPKPQVGRPRKDKAGPAEKPEVSDLPDCPEVVSVSPAAKTRRNIKQLKADNQRLHEQNEEILRRLAAVLGDKQDVPEANPLEPPAPEPKPLAAAGEVIPLEPPEPEPKPLVPYQAGGRGGRPSKPIQPDVVVFPRLKSKRQGKFEPSLGDKVKVGKWVGQVIQQAKQENTFKSRRELWQHLCAKAKLPRRQLETWSKQIPQLESEMHKQGVGFEGGKPSGSHGARRFQPNRGRTKGVRKKGGGAKNHLEPLMQGVKAWFLCEREYGRYVDRQDLFLEFSARVSATLQLLDIEAQGPEPLPMAERGLLDACKRFKVATDVSNPRCSKNREYRKDSLQQYCHGKHLQPQRLTNLTKQQEEFRLHQTWKLFDDRLWLSAFGSEKDLSAQVADPKKFISARESLVILQSDQVPFYCKVRPGKQLYAEHEYRKTGSKSVMSTDTKQGNLSGGNPTGGKPGKPKKQEGLTQLRGSEHSNQDKFRITIELCHEIHHWLSKDPTQQPVGTQGKHLLILPGAHADLSNIGDDHRYKADKRFVIKTPTGERPVHHKTGEYTHSLAGLVKLRAAEPKVREMLSLFIVMAQPAGFCDSVIMAWHLSHQAERYPCSLALRDLFTGGYADSSRMAMNVMGQVSSWVMSGMTPVCQLTDTSAAHILKQHALKAQDDLRRELRAKAFAQGVEPIYACSHYELLRVAYEACLGLEQHMDKSGHQRTIRDSVGNGVLAYKPCFEEMKLKPVTELPYFKDKGWKVGNHRMEAAWVKPRYDWLGEDGKPTGSAFEDPTHMMSDADLSEKKLTTADISAELQVSINYDDDAAAVLEVSPAPDPTEQQELVIATDWLSRVTSKEAFMKQEYDKLLTDQTKNGKGKKKLKRKQKARARHALRGEQMKDLREALSLHSTKQVMEAIVPGIQKAL